MTRDGGIPPEDSASPRDLLEPDAEKLAPPVLRGDHRSNAVVLPDTASGADGGTMSLRLLLGSARLRLEVTDQGSPDVPMIHTPNPDEEHGRGLWLIHLRCLRLYVRGDAQGHTVCVDIPWRTTPDHPDELGTPGHELTHT